MRPNKDVMQMLRRERDERRDVNITDDDLSIVAEMGMLAITITTLYESMMKQSPEVRADFARHHFEARQQLERKFPMPNDGEPFLGFCKACDLEQSQHPTHERPKRCKHTALARCAILTMSMLRITPPYDMDIDPNDTDPNQGCIPVEEN